MSFAASAESPGAPVAARVWLLHLGLVALLFVLQFVLPDYHHGVLARVMVLSVFAMGYNVLFGYAGLLSLGHAMFFAAGLYGAGLPIYHAALPVPLAFASGIACGAVLALSVGLLALRTTGVAFMIVTLMFAQVGYLMSLWMGAWTRGDEGLTLPRADRLVEFGPLFLDFADRDTRFLAAWLLFTVVLLINLWIASAPVGRGVIAIRPKEERTRMLGYDTYANKLAAVVVSGAICASAGAAYAILFGYVGSSFASIQYSILPLLWVLLGGAATVLGPLLGTLFMFYVVDITSSYTTAWLLVVGVALIALVLFFPKGVLGTVRERWLPWLP